MGRPTLYSKQFFDNVLPEPNSGCWLWDGGGKIHRFGYFYIFLNGRAQRVHRIAYEHYRGPIPPGMHVCHRCDVRSCVNPDHLFLGTNADNVEDRNKKGRQAKGVTGGNTKLTPEQVLEIRTSALGNRAVARQLGISHTAVGQIRRGKSWMHL